MKSWGDMEPFDKLGVLTALTLTVPVVVTAPPFPEEMMRVMIRDTDIALFASILGGAVIYALVIHLIVTYRSSQLMQAVEKILGR